jgi:hypothetical protein
MSTTSDPISGDIPVVEPASTTKAGIKSEVAIRAQFVTRNVGHAFVLRADGTVVSHQEAGGFLHGRFERLPLFPRDQIVLPEKVDNGVVCALHDWGQIISPLTLTTLAVSSVVK